MSNEQSQADPIAEAKKIRDAVDNGTAQAWPSIVSLISIVERVTGQRDEARDKAWALEINQDESGECAAELFGLVCAVLDNKPEAAGARVSLQKHIDHVHSCRKGSCHTELYGSRLRQERDAAIREKDVLNRREAISSGEMRPQGHKILVSGARRAAESHGHVARCACWTPDYPVALKGERDPRCLPGAKP